MILQKKTIFYILLGTLVLFISCAKKEEKKRVVTSKDELYVYLDSLEKRYEKACSRLWLARWNTYTEETSPDLRTAQSEIENIFQDTSVRNVITEWRNRSGSLADKQLTRRLELWHRVFMGGSIETDKEITTAYAILRQQYFGLRVPFDGLTISPADAGKKLMEERRQAKRAKLWHLIAGQTMKLRDSYVKLVLVRNEKAQALGFPNYYSLMLYLQAIDEGWLVRTFNTLDELTRLAYETQLATGKKKLRIKEFYPWDYDLVQKKTVMIPAKYFPADSIRNVLHKFADSIGFATDSLQILELVKSNVNSSMSTSIKIPEDIRFLFKSSAGIQAFVSAMNAYGNALRARFINVEYPILKGYGLVAGSSSPSYDEGIAKMFGEFIYDSLWLRTFTKAKEKDIRQYLQRHGSSGVFEARLLLVNFFTEYEFYKDPMINIDSLSHAMTEKYLLVSIYEDSASTFVLPASYIMDPLSFHRIMLRDMIAAQLHEALTGKFGERKATNSFIAEWLIKQLYATAESSEWYERIRNATGKSTEPGAYIRKLGIEHQSLITKKETN